MESLLGDLEAHDGMDAFHTEVMSGVADGGRIRIERTRWKLDAACVINAAGLAGPDLARRLAPQASGRFADRALREGAVNTR
jgi:L-2-hydroxyglutarate oxidase LhgO